MHETIGCRERDMRHYVHDSLNRFRIVTFSKKAIEFRDNMPIFVYATVSYITLAFPFLATIINTQIFASSLISLCPTIFL